MQNAYAAAVIQLIKDGQDVDQVLRGLATILTARSHEKLFQSVLRIVLRTLETHQSNDRVVVASSEDAIALEQAIAALAKQGVTKKLPTIVDPNIIGGFVTETNGVRIDASYKQTLLTLYQTITT